METLAQAMQRVKASTTLKAFCDARLTARPQDGRDRYACPNPSCMSGKSGRQGSDAAFHLYVNGRGEQRYKCSSCDIEGDIFDLSGILEGTTDTAEECNTVAAFAGVEGWHRDGETAGAPMRGPEPARDGTDRGEALAWEDEGRVTEEAPTPTEGATDYTAFYRQAHTDLMASPEALAYLHGRGITDETIERHMLGYVASWTHPKDGRHHTKRIIMPRTAHTYTARAFDAAERDYSPKYAKQLVGTQTDIFNLKAARGAEVVVIVEGELDAASVTQATGYAAVGLGSISNVRTFPEKAKETAPAAVWLVALDNDKPKEDGRNPGQDAQKRLLDLMREAGMTCLEVDGAALYGECKDANEVLTADPSRLKAALDACTADAREAAYRETMERYNVTDTAEALQSLYELREGREPIPTGFAMLDTVTGGGLHAKSLHVIGAQSSEGKTTVTLQIADHVAAQGRPALFVTIEQRTTELIAKSLSRMAYRRSGGRTTLTAREITNPKEREAWTADKWQALTDACNEYGETVAPFLHFMDPDEPPTVRAIWEYAEAMTERYGEAPAVFVDYLQLLAPTKGHERDTDRQITNANVTMLRRMAGKLNTPVWVVAALNRQSYTEPIAKDSFRESSAIEYGADVLIGLEPFDLETRWHNATPNKRPVVAKGLHEKTTQAVKRWMDLRILKNRFGTLTSDGIAFVYRADADTFEAVRKVKRERRADAGEAMGEPAGPDDAEGLVI